MAGERTLDGARRFFGAAKDRTDDRVDDELWNPWIAGAAVLVLVLLPLLPVFLVAWSISRTLRGVRRRVSWE